MYLFRGYPRCLSRPKKTVGGDLWVALRQPRKRRRMKRQVEAGGKFPSFLLPQWALYSHSFAPSGTFLHGVFQTKGVSHFWHKCCQTRNIYLSWKNSITAELNFRPSLSACCFPLPVAQISYNTYYLFISSASYWKRQWWWWWYWWCWERGGRSMWWDGRQTESGGVCQMRNKCYRAGWTNIFSWPQTALYLPFVTGCHFRILEERETSDPWDNSDIWL